MKQLLTYFIALVWFINGLYCKVLNQVPRHQEIVGRILGDDLAPNLTILIGISEIIMAGWVLSRYRSRLNAIIQIALVLLMNIIESLLAHDLLFWGRSNGFFAFIFIAVIYYNEFVLHKNTSF